MAGLEVFIFEYPIEPDLAPSCRFIELVRRNGPRTVVLNNLNSQASSNRNAGLPQRALWLTSSVGLSPAITTELGANRCQSFGSYIQQSDLISPQPQLLFAPFGAIMPLIAHCSSLVLVDHSDL